MTTTRARVTGVVFDSIAMRPMAGAVVQLVLAIDRSDLTSATTSANGSFVFDSVPSGTWLIGFFHPSLDLLGIEGSLARIDIRETGTLHVALATPSGKTIATRACKVDVSKDSTGLFLGHVRDARRRALEAPAHIRVQWNELTIGKDGIERRTPSVEALTTPTGAFAVCGVPVAATVLARAWSGADSSGFVELEMPAGGFMQRDVLIGSVAKATLSVPNDSTAGDSLKGVAQVARGDGRLRGVVRRPNGEAVDGARLIFWGSGVEAATNANGVYSMRELPTGTWTLEARALGFLPVRQPVDVYPDSELVVNVELERIGAILDTVKVTAQRIYISPEMRDFEQRRKAGFGYFMDEDAINKRSPVFTSDLFRMAPGVTVLPSSGFGYSVLMRSRSLMSAYCVPAFFIDGMRVTMDFMSLDDVVSGYEVRAIEVYTRASNVPPQFNTMNGCGSIVVHTGGRRPTPTSGKR
ncbi:MAG: carboxypeptidase-like regulatory domain-containing protein [Gemmatimonadaceae bacterium]